LSGPGCPLCETGPAERWAKARDVEYCTTDEEFTYWRCGRCGVLFVDPMPTGRLTEIYPDTYYAYASMNQGFVHRLKDRLDHGRFRRILRRLPGSSLSVLDVGGGDGWTLSVLRGLDPRVRHSQVVDLDPAAGEFARRQGHEYFCGRIEDFETDQSFDLILLLNLIEHVAEPRRVLAKVHDWLKPDGIALVKTPNIDSLDARIFRHRDWGGYHCPRHWILFDRASLTQLAGDTGLSVHRFSYTQGAPFWTVSVLASLARFGLVKISRDRPVVQHPLFPLLSAGFAVTDFARAAVGGKPSQMFVELARAD
jgi:SAM-dependent methyltransferase